MPVRPKEKSFRRTHLGWLWELAERRRDVKVWREFGEEAPKLPLQVFAERGHALVSAHDRRRDESLDWWSMARHEPLRYRLLIERKLNTDLREFAEEPKGHGQFEFELHWTRWALSMLVGILRAAVWRAEEGMDVRERYHRDSVSEFAEMDKVWPMLQTATDEELFQAVHKIAGRTNLA